MHCCCEAVLWRMCIYVFLWRLIHEQTTVEWVKIKGRDREIDRQTKIDRGNLWGKCCTLSECEIASVYAHVWASALALSLCWMKYEADQPLSDSGWGRSGMGWALHQGSLSQKWVFSSAATVHHTHTSTQACSYRLVQAPAFICDYVHGSNHKFGMWVVVALAYVSVCVCACALGINTENKHYHLTKAPDGSPWGLQQNGPPWNPICKST